MAKPVPDRDRKLGVFNLVTVDGYIAGPGGDISWHRVDPEFQEFAEEGSNSGRTLLFGRVTYELMASYWPTAESQKNDPVVAKGMNGAPKVVFSRTLKKVDWANTRLVKGDLLGEVRRLKQAETALTILGSASVVAQLAQAELIDEYQRLVVPVALGAGKTMFEGIKATVDFTLTKTQAFGNGSMLLTYRPA